MLYQNSDGASSAFASPMSNPWLGAAGVLGLGQVPIQAWPAVGSQVALQQWLAHQLAAQNLNQAMPGATQRAAIPLNVSLSQPVNMATLSLTVQQIAHSLNVLAQQLSQYAAQGSMISPWGHQFAGQMSHGQAIANPFFATPLGQQFAPGLALH